MGFLKNYVVPMIFAVFIVTFSLISGLELIIFSESFFEWHYTNHNVTSTTGMSVDDLMDVTVKMLDYLKDDRDTLNMTATIHGVTGEVFGQREKDHMVDVKILYLQARNLRRGAFAGMVLMLFGGWLTNRQGVVIILDKIPRYVPALLVIIGAIGALFATDFNRYFTLFHHIFFDNDLWLLDPRTDILINMVPEVYFYSIVMIGLGIFVTLIALFIMGSILGKRQLVGRWLMK